MMASGAWGYARSAAARNLAGARANNASHQRVGGYDAMHDFLRDRFANYNFERHTCFFCCAKAHRTGYFTGYGKIWLCKERCQDKYTVILAALAEAGS